MAGKQIRAQQPQPRDSTVSLTDLIEDHQRVAIDTEEVISRSDWTNPNSTACRSAFHRASLGKVKNSGAAYRAQRSLMFAPWNATARLIAWASTSTSLCSRHVRPSRLSSDVSEIKLVFSIPSHRPTPNFAPSWNVAPTDLLPVVRFHPRAGERSLDVLRWGLVPFSTILDICITYLSTCMVCRSSRTKDGSPSCSHKLYGSSPV